MDGGTVGGGRTEEHYEIKEETEREREMRKLKMIKLSP
jgi:hypothetical protein